MNEEVYMHVVTKGGESYCRRLGTCEHFCVGEFLSKTTNVPWYPLVEVEDDVFVAWDSILRLWFTRMEVH